MSVESISTSEAIGKQKLSFENTSIAFQSKTNGELKKAYWLFKIIGKPVFTKVGKVLTNIAMGLRIPIGWAVKPTVFAQFCGGETIAECASTTKVLDKYGIGTILDYSVEGKEDESDFDTTAEEICNTVRTADNNAHIPFCVFKVSGIARFSLLEKKNARKPFTDKENEEWLRVEARVNKICSLAHETGTPVFIDAEETWIQDAIDELAEKMMSAYNTKSGIVYNTIQLYRHDRLAFLKASFLAAEEKGYHLAVKLVRGAYMEKESARAEEKGYLDPIQPDKPATDRDFDLAVAFCVEHIHQMAVCVGTHNEQSCMKLAVLLMEKGISFEDKRVYVAQLYGMSDHISFNMADGGYNVAKYVPYGPIKEVIPYLIRRAEENTSVEGQTGRELSLILKEMKRRKLEG